jgi:ribosome modulation factor
MTLHELEQLSAYQAGREAAKAGLPDTMCPYSFFHGNNGAHDQHAKAMQKAWLEGHRSVRKPTVRQEEFAL